MSKSATEEEKAIQKQFADKLAQGDLLCDAGGCIEEKIKTAPGPAMW